LGVPQPRPITREIAAGAPDYNRGVALDVYKMEVNVDAVKVNEGSRRLFLLSERVDAIQRRQ